VKLCHKFETIKFTLQVQTLTSYTMPNPPLPMILLLEKFPVASFKLDNLTQGTVRAEAGLGGSMEGTLRAGLS
jgi:hypothetical protein